MVDEASKKCKEDALRGEVRRESVRTVYTYSRFLFGRDRDFFIKAVKNILMDSMGGEAKGLRRKPGPLA